MPTPTPLTTSRDQVRPRHQWSRCVDQQAAHAEHHEARADRPLHRTFESAGPQSRPPRRRHHRPDAAAVSTAGRRGRSRRRSRGRSQRQHRRETPKAASGRRSTSASAAAPRSNIIVLDHVADDEDDEAPGHDRDDHVLLAPALLAGLDQPVDQRARGERERDEAEPVGSPASSPSTPDRVSATRSRRSRSGC